MVKQEGQNNIITLIKGHIKLESPNNQGKGRKEYRNFQELEQIMS